MRAFKSFTDFLFSFLQNQLDKRVSGVPKQITNLKSIKKWNLLNGIQDFD